LHFAAFLLKFNLLPVLVFDSALCGSSLSELTLPEGQPAEQVFFVKSDRYIVGRYLA